MSRHSRTLTLPHVRPVDPLAQVATVTIHVRLSAPGASVGVYNRRMYPWSIGDDVQEMYWHLRRAVMLYDVPETPLEISGPRRARS